MNIQIQDIQNFNNFLNALMSMRGEVKETEEEKLNKEICYEHYLNYIKKTREYLSVEHQEYKEEYEHENISATLCKMGVAFWTKKGELPTDPSKFNEFVEFCCNYKKEKNPCICMVEMETEEQKSNVYEIVKKVILDIGTYPGCDIISGMLEYKLLNGNIPTINEYKEYVKNLEEFHEDPEKYHLDHKHQLPTMNRNLLKKSIYKEEISTICGVCQNDIKKEDSIYQLPCNGKHIFHSEDKDCLEGLTIMDWMKSNKTCPLCKDELKIEDKKIE